MKMTTRIFSSDEIKDLKIEAIARKYRCSGDYVRRVLKGERDRNSELSQKILKDAMDMQEIINRETTIETWQQHN